MAKGDVGGDYTVADGDTLAELLAWGIARKGCSWKELRRKDRRFCQLRSTWCDLMAKKRGVISASTFGRLLLFFERLRDDGHPDRCADLVGCVLSASEQAALTSYEWWISTTTAWPSRDGLAELLISGEEMLQTRHALESWRILTKIEQDEPCDAELVGFVRWASLERGHEPERIELALHRIIEPLVQAATVAVGVERSLDELSKRDLHRFIKAGVERERIVLDRQRAVPRVQAFFSGRRPVTIAPHDVVGAGLGYEFLPRSKADERRPVQSLLARIGVRLNLCGIKQPPPPAIRARDAPPDRISYDVREAQAVALTRYAEEAESQQSMAAGLRLITATRCVLARARVSKVLKPSPTMQRRSGAPN